MGVDLGATTITAVVVSDGQCSAGIREGIKGGMIMRGGMREGMFDI